MSAERSNSAAASAAVAVVADADDRHGERSCPCLPFRLRGRRRYRFRVKLSWFSWSWWFRRSSTKKNEARKKPRKGRRMFLLFASLRSKEGLASVSGDLFPKVRSFGDTKKQNQTKPRPAVDTNTTPSNTGVQVQQRPQCLPRTTEPAATAARPAACQPGARPAGAPSGVKRSPSERLRLLRPGRGADTGAGLWTMATTLGAVVFFGRVTAVIFLCSCLYATRFVRAQTSAGSQINGEGSTRCGDRTAERAVDLCTEEHKKKVVMEGLLERAGKRPSSRFCD